MHGNPRKPTTMSEERRLEKFKQARKVSVIHPEMPPMEIKKQLKKHVSIKEQYDDEYERIQ